MDNNPTANGPVALSQAAGSAHLNVILFRWRRKGNEIGYLFFAAGSTVHGNGMLGEISCHRPIRNVFKQSSTMLSFSCPVSSERVYVATIFLPFPSKI